MDIYSINRKVQKNNRKILIQVGLAVTLILIIGISIIALIFLYTNIRTFLMEKNRGISADLYTIKNSFYSDFNNQLFDIWREKPDEIKLYEEDEFPYPGLQNVYEVNEKKYEGFSEKEKVKYAQDYYNVIYALLSEYLEHLHMDYSNVFVMDIFKTIRISMALLPVVWKVWYIRRRVFILKQEIRYLCLRMVQQKQQMLPRNSMAFIDFWKL